MARRGFTLAIVLAVCAALLASGVSSGGERPSVLALVTRQLEGKRVLVRLDARTLEPRPGRRVPLPLDIYGWAFSSDRSRVVFGDERESVLRFADVERVRAWKKMDLRSKGNVYPLWWPAQRRLFVFAGEGLVLVDPVSGRVLRRTPLAGAPQFVAGDWFYDGRTTPDRLVLLLYPFESIAPAHVVVVDREGRIRSVVLDQIRSGFEVSSEGVRKRFPAIAVDSERGRAYVIGAGEPVAEIDLATLQVTYHEPLPVASAPAGDSQPAGLVRFALWAGDGRFALWGEDQDLSQSTLRSIGLSLVDTRSWTSRLLNERATSARVAGETILAFGGSAFVEGREIGVGLRAYRPDGQERFHRFDDGFVGRVEPFGQYAYVSLSDPARVYVVDLRTGKILRRIVSPFAFSFFLVEQ